MLSFTDEELVSSDFIHNVNSSIYDSKATIVQGCRFVPEKRFRKQSATDGTVCRDLNIGEFPGFGESREKSEKPCCWMCVFGCFVFLGQGVFCEEFKIKVQIARAWLCFFLVVYLEPK